MAAEAAAPRAALGADDPVLGPGWAVLEFAAEPASADPGALTGAWQVVSGERPGDHVTLWRFDAPAEVALAARPALWREVLRPTAFSPLQ